MYSTSDVAGLNLFAAYLQSKVPDVKVEIIDGFFDSDEEIVRRVSDSDFVGIGGTTPQVKHMIDLSKKINDPGIESYSIDGMNVIEIFNFAKKARERAINKKGPTFLNCITYRYNGHFTNEENRGFNYRSSKEIETWRKKDPLLLIKNELTIQYFTIFFPCILMYFHSFIIHSFDC